MNFERMELLVTVLETKVKPEKFSFKHWVSYGWGGKPDLSCGVNACMLGWATTEPAFGMSLVRPYPGDTAWVSLNAADEKFYSGYGDPNRKSLKTAMTVFDLTQKEADYIFMPNSLHPDHTSLAPFSGSHYSPGENANLATCIQHVKNYIQYCRDKAASQAQPQENP